MATIEEITRNSMSLTEVERARLALTLIRSLDGPVDEGAAATWDKEIERRVAEIKSGAVEGRSAEDVFAEIRARYQ